jgi:hypothetical protein
MSVEASVTAKTSFGQWLRQRRKVLDLTQDDLISRFHFAPLVCAVLDSICS